MPWHVEKRDGEFCVIKDSDGESEGCHETEEKAKAQMRALYATENRKERAPIEARAATIANVDFPERVITTLAMPYEQEAFIEYRGELWRESFERTAFDGVETRPNRVKAFRDHVAGANPKGTGTSGLVGRVVMFDPKAPEGLIAKTKIAKTVTGDDTLALAAEGVLGVSLGFGVRGSDQVFNRAEMTRRIKRAFVDHLAFPDNGAYDGAQVIEVRADNQSVADMPPLVTPYLDDVIAWMESRKAIR